MTFAQPFSEYEVIDRVGAGSMGTVFKARHKKLDRIVALKVLKPSLGRDARYVERLRREARIVASLNHPNIVTGYDLGQEGGYHFFVMEFVEGKSLRELLSEWGMFDEARVLDVATQITIALDHAFQCGVIHRDIKPANILIADNNVVKLTDMGLAKGPDSLTITRDGATVGTPQYISPEQARNPQDVDVRTDLYSLGATLFHMCTGQPPFRAETMANVLCKVLEERAPSAAGINPDLSDGLNLIIRKLLSKAPDRRYQTPAELLADLQRVQRAELPHVKEGDLDRGEDEKTPSSPVKLGLFVLGAVAVLAVLASLALVDWGGKTDGIPLAERKRAFHRQVEDELAVFHKVGLQIRCVEGLRENAAESFEEDYLDQKLAGLNQRLIGAVELLFDQEADDLDQTFEKLSWNRTRKDLQDRVKDRVFDEVGIQVSQLRGAAAAAYKKEWGELENDVQAKTLARESEFERAVAEYGQRLHGKVRAHLSEPDFLQAAKDLAAGLRDFDRVSEDVPRAAELPEKLREVVRQARRKHASDLDTLITGMERARLKTFESGLQDVKARVEKLLAAHDPREARGIYEELSRALERDFPRRFRVQHDPWPDADFRLRLLGASLGFAEAAQRQTALRQLVGTTYRIVLSGDLSKARSELVVGAAGRQEPSLPKHIDLLDHAISVRSKLLGALLGTKKLHRLRGIRTQLGALDVELRRRGGDFILQASRPPRPIALGLLRVRDLVPSDFVSGLSTELRAGLAVWYLLTATTPGVEEVAFLTEGSPLSGFVRDDLAPLLRDLKLERPEPGWLADHQLLESVRKWVSLSKWVEAKDALSSLRTQTGSFAADNDQELRRLERAIRSGTARSVLEVKLRTQILEGGELQVGAELDVSVEYKDLSKVGFPGGLPSGWTREEESARIAFDDDHVALDEAKELTFKSLCGTNKPMYVGFEFAFAADRGVTRLFFLTMHEATLGVAALRDGTLAVFEVDKLRAGKELRDRVQKALRSAERQPQVYLVPGARHRLEIDVRPRGLGGRVVLAARVDGHKLPEVSIVRSTGKVPAIVTLTTLHSLEAYSFVFRGAGR